MYRQDEYNFVLEHHKKGIARTKGNIETVGWRFEGFYPSLNWLVANSKVWVNIYPNYASLKKSEMSAELKKNIIGFKKKYEISLQVCDYFKDKDVSLIQKELDKEFELSNPPSKRGQHLKKEKQNEL